MADNYTILKQRQNMNISEAGLGFDDVWDITVRVTDGPSKGTVFTATVPEADHNAMYVKQTIEDKIKQLDAVHSL
jgi:hypothetical protein